jgi:hypothetical protein
MSRRRPLVIEHLEARDVPTLFGTPWPDAAHLTLSLAPDGTSVGGQTSNLYQSLGSQTSSEAWQREILRAFQTWASVANINFGIVGDGGQAVGAAGRLQGDSRFGDIRISALAMSPEVLAITTPFVPTAGTWSGDVRVNSSYAFGVNGAGGVDLYTALLQEAGHSLGLNNSADVASVMYEYYRGVRAGLSAADVAAIQALYGARKPDRFEGSSGNDRIDNATVLGLLRNSDGSLGVGADGDLTTTNDVDFYRFQAPLNLGGMTIRLRTGGLSLASARITVYDSARRVVGTSAATDPLNGGVAEVRLNKLLPFGTYFVKVEGATDDVFGVGNYRLEVGSLPLLGGLTDVVGNLVDVVNGVLRDDLHTDDSILTASLLPLAQGAAATPSRFDQAFQARLRDRWDVDYYRIVAPSSGSVMTAMVWGTQNNGLLPKVSVYDSAGRRVASEVLVNEAGTQVVQVEGVRAGATYFVKVEADDRGATEVGNYFLGVDFSNSATQMEEFTAGSMSAGDSRDVNTLVVTRNELYHFVLSPSSVAGVEAAVRATFYDANGRVVGSVMATDGEATSVTLMLTPGTYTVSFSAATRDGRSLPAMNYALTGSRLSDPIGPQAEEPMSGPQSAPPPSGSGTPTQSPSYYPPPSGTTSSPPPSGSGSGTTTSSPPPSSTSPSSGSTTTSSGGSSSNTGTSSSPSSEPPSWYWYSSGSMSTPSEDPYSDPYTIA